MGGRGYRAIASALLMMVTAGCAAVQSTADVAVGYNRTFANSRNEILLLNVLRAAAREPLQFSTMGSVTGSVGNSASITIPFTNVIAGGRDAISPSLTIGDAVNPNVAIIPLGAQDFVRSILTPVTPGTIQLFLHGGWDAEFLLPLIVGGIICPDGRLLLNSGEYEQDGSTFYHDAFRTFFYESARQFSVAPMPAAPGADQSFTVSDERAMALVRDGAGANFRIVSVADAAAGSKRVTIAPIQTLGVRGLQIRSLCASIAGREGAQVRNVADRLGALDVAGGEGSVIFRSVGTIIQYLGESHRVRTNAGTIDRNGLNYWNQDREVQILFRADSGVAAGTGRAVETRFHDTTYYVPRLDLRGDEGNDRTLKTLSFLDQLIALQTTESTIRSAQPIISILQ